jgi:antitoxin (DNA-binding transcriptional repressor) of toxin-antitoxin stability system
MKFIASREFRVNTAHVFRDLKKEQTLVVTNHGQPVALVVPTSGENLEQDFKMLASLRFGQAVRAIQAQSVKNGTDKMTMEEINAEIEAARREAGE